MALFCPTSSRQKSHRRNKGYGPHRGASGCDFHLHLLAAVTTRTQQYMVHTCAHKGDPLDYYRTNSNTPHFTPVSSIHHTSPEPRVSGVGLSVLHRASVIRIGFDRELTSKSAGRRRWGITRAGMLQARDKYVHNSVHRGNTQRHLHRWMFRLFCATEYNLCRSKKTHTGFHSSWT